MEEQWSSSSPEAVWGAAFEEVCERIGPIFARSETRERAQAYLRGLLSPIERKNGWQMAEEAGEATPYAMQYLLDRARWESDQLRDEVRAYVHEKLGDPEAVLVIDETGFLKQGTKSVGVQRQYSGTAGRIENCQVGVFLSYSSSQEHTLLDRELYLPKSWTQDPARCREADVPIEVGFATKPELAARMLWRTLDAGVPAAWVRGDTVYGSHRLLRAGLETRQQAYALAVTCQEHVEVAGKQQRVDQVVQQVTPQDWHRLSAGVGSKGARLYDWVRLPLSSSVPGGWERWLVIRRSIPAGAEPPEMAYVLVFAGKGPPCRRWSPSWGPAGRWSSALRGAKARSDSTSMRCVPGRAGTGTSRSACWRKPSSPCCGPRAQARSQNRLSRRGKNGSIACRLSAVRTRSRSSSASGD